MCQGFRLIEMVLEKKIENMFRRSDSIHERNLRGTRQKFVDVSILIYKDIRLTVRFCGAIGLKKISIKLYFSNCINGMDNITLWKIGTG